MASTPLSTGQRVGDRARGELGDDRRPVGLQVDDGGLPSLVVDPGDRRARRRVGAPGPAGARRWRRATGAPSAMRSEIVTLAVDAIGRAAAPPRVSGLHARSRREQYGAGAREVARRPGRTGRGRRSGSASPSASRRSRTYTSSVVAAWLSTVSPTVGAR